MTYNELITSVVRHLHRIGDIDVLQMAGLAEGTNDHTLKTTSAIIFNIYNQQISKAATDNIAMTACAIQAVNTFCYYLVSINVSGTITTTKGIDNTYALPATPFGTVPIGAFKVVTDATHTFTSGTTDLSATGVTATLYDIDCGIVASLINQAMRRLEKGITVNIDGVPQTLSNFEHMKTRAEVALVSGTYYFSDPFTNYKALICAHIKDSAGYTWPALSRVNYATAMKMYPYLTANLDRPLLISRIPTVETSWTPDIAPSFQWILRPSSDAAYTLDLQAYQYSPSLDGVIYQTNWWTQNVPEALLYGALIEIAPYLKEDERIPTWKDQYNTILVGLINSQKEERNSGSNVNIPSDNPLASEIYDSASEIYEYD